VTVLCETRYFAGRLHRHVVLITRQALHGTVGLKPSLTAAAMVSRELVKLTLMVRTNCRRWVVGQVTEKQHR